MDGKLHKKWVDLELKPYYLIRRCFSPYRPGVAALDGFCCHGDVVCLCGFVLPSTQMVIT